MTTSKRKKQCHEVNVKANLAMAELGQGREAMATVCSIFGMPPPSSKSSWEMHNETLSSAVSSACDIQLKTAAKNLRHELSKDDPTIEEDNVIDVAVSFDGTWHHRGFKSSHGVGVVISVDTGEVLDAEVISKTCHTCQRSSVSKNAEEFKQWQEKHIKDGECLCNFEGPSTGMETAAARAIWSRSVTKNNMRYTSILSDGDNKTVQALNEMKVYGSDTEITKLECVNHIHKRMGTGLRNLVKKSPFIKGGKGGLTTILIEKLSSYYRKHIMDHVTSSKNSDDINEAVKKMKINILAGLHHSVHNDNPNVQHKYCMDDCVKWCKYKNQLENENSPPSTNATSRKKRTKKLPESFLPHMIPLYTRLSDEALLKRCIAGLTQNQNESFNATLWKRCPKEKYFGTSAVRRALALAILFWNAGHQGLYSVFNELQMVPNAFTKRAIATKDKQRLASSSRAVHAKKKRKLVRESSCDDYTPGGH